MGLPCVGPATTTTIILAHADNEDELDGAAARWVFGLSVAPTVEADDLQLAAAEWEFQKARGSVRRILPW